MMQAVQVLIERMNTHPEEFFGDVDAPHLMRSSKFSDIIEKLDDLLTGDGGMVKTKNFHRLWFLTADEQTALLDAYKEARRSRFEAKIFHTLMRPDTEQEEQMVKFRTQGRYGQNLGASMQNTATNLSGAISGVYTDPRIVFGSAPIKAEGSSV
jgi:hypothetical protein